ncbi:MAG: GNAT family N-acetyltransferase [Theionarchaea archaeon]|nr:GNAT family N-acetyltransferase [Theionarchaea archaeon]
MSKGNGPLIAIPDAPDIPGLTFRHFQGESDYPHMIEVIEQCKQEDRFEETITTEDMARFFKHLVNCDPYTDMLFAEVNGDVIGYTRVWWGELKEVRVYRHFALLIPEWRGKDISRCMLRYNEQRLRDIAAQHPKDNPSFFQARAQESEVHWISLLLSENYKPVRHYFLMVRSLLEDIPSLPLSEGLEIRPAAPEHYRTIWSAADEALQDHWGGSDLTDEELAELIERPTFDPGLWVVAWDTATDSVAGVVLTTVDAEENQEYERKRAYLGPIGVRRPYRRKGLASVLIARSFHLLRNAGMTEAALGVDAENPEGALQLYEKMGFSTIIHSATYRKPMD